MARELYPVTLDMSPFVRSDYAMRMQTRVREWARTSANVPVQGDNLVTRDVAAILTEATGWRPDVRPWAVHGWNVGLDAQAVAIWLDRSVDALIADGTIRVMRTPVDVVHEYAEPRGWTVRHSIIAQEWSAHLYRGSFADGFIQVDAKSGGTLIIQPCLCEAIGLQEAERAIRGFPAMVAFAAELRRLDYSGCDYPEAPVAEESSEVPF